MKYMKVTQFGIQAVSLRPTLSLITTSASLGFQLPAPITGKEATGLSGLYSTHLSAPLRSSSVGVSQK